MLYLNKGEGKKMTKKLKKIAKKYNGSVHIVKKKSCSKKDFEKALHSIILPKGASLKQAI